MKVFILLMMFSVNIHADEIDKFMVLFLHFHANVRSCVNEIILIDNVGPICNDTKKWIAENNKKIISYLAQISDGELTIPKKYNMDTVTRLQTELEYDTNFIRQFNSGEKAGTKFKF